MKSLYVRGNKKTYSFRSKPVEVTHVMDAGFLIMKTLCITTGKEWDLAEAEFKRVGLTVERFDAIVEDNRPLAFNKSVYACMKLAERKPVQLGNSDYETLHRIEHLLLFEDDVVFENFHARIDVTQWQLYLPSDFMTLHLGGNIIGTDSTIWEMPTLYDENLAVVKNIWQSHATLYSAECVKFILDNMNPNVIDEQNHIFDDWLRLNVLNQGRSYLMKPMIAYQRPKTSEIWGHYADYTGCHKQGNEWLKNNL